MEGGTATDVTPRLAEHQTGALKQEEKPVGRGAKRGVRDATGPKPAMEVEEFLDVTDLKLLMEAEEFQDVTDLKLLTEAEEFPEVTDLKLLTEAEEFPDVMKSESPMEAVASQVLEWGREAPEQRKTAKIL